MNQYMSPEEAQKMNEYLLAQKQGAMVAGDQLGSEDLRDLLIKALTANAPAQEAPKSDLARAMTSGPLEPGNWLSRKIKSLGSSFRPDVTQTANQVNQSRSL